ncbi:MAG: Asp-tRNA(Asn)/Glu-tRNA(Gln) amidotransferase subunit GatC [Pseudomonadota bacterium]
MSIGSDDIEKLAVLARLSFEGDELGDITDKLASIVAFVDQLGAADTASVTPMAHPLDQVQRLRADTPNADIDRARLQACSEATEDGLYLVPRVIE